MYYKLKTLLKAPVYQIFLLSESISNLDAKVYETSCFEMFIFQNKWILPWKITENSNKTHELWENNLWEIKKNYPLGKCLQEK